jgi:hypothetical protein
LYHQCAGERSGSFGGLGVGLALVKLIVELHGGSVTAYSDGEGSGSTFTVHLPGVARLSMENPDLAKHEVPVRTAFSVAGRLCLPAAHLAYSGLRGDGCRDQSHSVP